MKNLVILFVLSSCLFAEDIISKIRSGVIVSPQQIADIHSDVLFDALFDNLKINNRKLSINTIALIRSQENYAFDYAKRRLKSNDFVERLTAAWGLVGLRPDYCEVLSVLQQGITDSNSFYCGASIGNVRLLKCPKQNLAKIILDAYHRNNSFIKAQALMTLEQIQPDWVTVEMLCSHLPSNDPNLTLVALDLLTKKQPKDSCVTTVLALLQHPQKLYHIPSYHVLQQIGPGLQKHQTVVEKMLSIIENKNHQYYREAFRVLQNMTYGLTSHPQVVDKMLTMLEKNDKNQIRALKVIRDMGQSLKQVPNAIMRLQKISQHSRNAFVRKKSLVILQKLR